MEQQRLKRMPVANQQQQVVGPEAMHMVPGNMLFYNPNQFAPNVPPNGSYNPPHFHPNAQVKETWHWDENTNTIPSYQPEPNLLNPSGVANPQITSANYSHQVPALYGPGDNAPQHNPTAVYPPSGHHTANNNQHDSKSNQNWGDWNDQGWGWSDEPTVASGHHHSQPLHSQTDFTQVNSPESSSEAPQSIPLVTTKNLEQGMSSLSLSAPNQDSEVPSVPAPPMAGHSEPLSWSKVPMNAPEPIHQEEEIQSWSQVSGWDTPSVKKEEVVSSQIVPEEKYPAVLGERNTSADGASFTDGLPQQPFPPQQPMIDPPATLPPPNLEAAKPNFYLGSQQQQPPSRPSSIPPLGLTQPPASLASAARTSPMFQSPAIPGAPHVRTSDGLQSLPPFPSDGTASSIEEPMDSPAPASLPPFIESHTPVVPTGPPSLSNSLPPPPRSAGLMGPAMTALNRGSPYVGGINGSVRSGLVSSVLPPTGHYSTGSQQTLTEAESALTSPVPSLGGPRPPVLPSPVSNPTIFSPVGSVSMESVTTEPTYVAPAPGSYSTDSENAAVNTDGIPSNVIGGAQRSQSGTPLLERESERPDAEGGYENDLPTPLANPAMYTQVSSAYGMERKVNHESPSGSRPASRQAGSTPSEPGSMAPPAYYPDNLASNPISSYGRPKSGPGGNTYPTTSAGSAAPPPTTPTMAPPISARGTQEAVGSEFRQPPSNAPVPRASVMSQQQMESNAGPSILPPSSQRMIPGSGSQAPPLVGPPQQTVQHGPVRTSVSSASVTEQRIVTGYAKNDPPAAPPLAPAPIAMDRQQTPQDETRISRSPPPPHRSETIGSENPRMNMAPAPGPMGPGNGAVDRAEDGRNANDRDREHKVHDNRSRTERDRDRDADFADRERSGRNRYTDDDEDERYSTGYRDRRYDDRERRYDDRERRYEDRDRERDRERDRDHRSGYDYDLDRSGYGDRGAERDRGRDSRRRESRRSDYYLEPDVYGDRSGRRSSLYDGDMETATDFNRSAYGFNTSRDGRRRDFDRSRHEERYYQSQRPSHAGSTSGDVAERATSERDYRTGRDPRYDMYSRDPRDPYYQHPSYNYYRGAYDPYRQYPPGYNYYSIDYQMKYAAWIEEMKKNPAVYSEWYQRTYGQRYTPSVTTGPGTAAGSIAASEADRASVHSGRSSVNEEPNQMSQAIRGSTTGLEQQGLLDYSVFPDEETNVAISHQDLTPHKYSSAHVIARFSAGGLLCRVLPNNPKEGTAAYVELHDLNVLLEDLPSVQDFKYFPGPLIPGQTHKQQVMVFCQQKIRLAQLEESRVAENDRSSYILLWEFLLLLLRQNGTVVGTDIAELLLKDHEILKEPLIQECDVVDQTVTDRTLVSRQSEASITKRFRELLLFGNKKEALEWAMSQGLWGHALFLASKMDQRTYSSVMIRFANGLALNDPLQTLYQLMSGRQPASVTNCGDDKWGDWRPHLAMILSNSTSKPELDKKSIVTLGDSLAAKGYVLAAHFCYLVAQVEFGDYSNKSSKLVLLSSSTAQSFEKFATNEAIQCTEVYEYVRQLASPEFVIPSFQSYKFLYATRLAEHGRAAEALQYCEVVGNAMAKNPSIYPSTLVSRVYDFGSMLKFHDPQYQTENDGTPFTDPAWLTALVAASQSSLPSLSSVPQVPEVIQSPAEDSLSGPQSIQQPAFYEQNSQQQQPEYQSYSDHTASPVHQSQVQPQYIDQTDSQQYQPQQQSQHQSFYERQDSSQYLQPQPQPTSLQSYGGEEDKQQSRLTNAELDQSNNQYGSLSAQGYNYQSYGQADSWQSNSGYGDQQTTPAFYSQSGSGPESHDYWRNSSLPTGGNDEDGSGRNSYAAGETSSAGNTPTAAGGKKEGGKSAEDKDDKDKSASSSSSGWLGGLFSWKKNPKSNHPVPMKLPDDKNPRIVWDENLKRWVDTDKKDGDDVMAPPPPPPMAPAMGPVPSSSTNMPSPTGSLSAAPPALNLRANLRGRTGLNKYVNNGTIPTKSADSAGMSFLDPFTGSNAGSTVTSPVGPGLGAPMIFTPTPSAGPAGAAQMDFVSAPASGPQSAPDSLPPQAAEPSGPFMYNPSQFAATPAPSSAAGRGGLRRYPR